MTNEQNIALVAKHREAVANGDLRAKRRIEDAIVSLNQGLVRRLAMRFGRPQNEEDKEDAMQAGSMGVLRAIQDFNPELGTFSTHAGNHIRDYIQRFSGKTVSVARPRSASMPASIARIASKYRMTHGREPSAQDLGVTEAQLDDWSSGTHFVEIAATTDDHRTSGSGSSGIELSGNLEEAEHVGARYDIRAAWEAAIGDLSPRNVAISRAFWLEGKEVHDIAAEHGLTHGRVVQICKRTEVRLKRAIDPEAYTAGDVSVDDRRKAADSARWRARQREAKAS